MTESPKRLVGKVALVTGAAGGIGRAICRRYAAEGASVLCADINSTSVAETVAQVETGGGAASWVSCDVSDSVSARAAVDAALDRFGALHILVNNAAFFLPDATLPELDEALFARAFAVNVTGAFLMSRWAIPGIIRSGGGSIIHIASQMGSVARRLQTTYSATKGALLLLAKGMALDHAADGIRVNTLSPGGIATTAWPSAGATWRRRSANGASGCIRSDGSAVSRRSPAPRHSSRARKPRS